MRWACVSSSKNNLRESEIFVAGTEIFSPLKFGVVLGLGLDLRMSISSHYEVAKAWEDNKLKFYFESIGQNVLTKVIEFELTPIILIGRVVYNLGFGDKMPDEPEVFDTSISNNGDAYRVFNTVLSTVPVFFEHFPEAAILVRGSDGIDNYFEKCILHCSKACITKCRKEGRRMTIYRSFVNKYYEQLKVDYFLLGGINYARSLGIGWEDYVVGRYYDALLVFKRK